MIPWFRDAGGVAVRRVTRPSSNTETRPILRIPGTRLGRAGMQMDDITRADSVGGRGCQVTQEAQQ